MWKLYAHIYMYTYNVHTHTHTHTYTYVQRKDYVYCISIQEENFQTEDEITESKARKHLGSYMYIKLIPTAT